jgi:CheY-like chemotaxis protein
MPKTLLLADDSVTIQKVVGISFANEDVILLTVDNGDDAIHKAREVRPDLVLADVVMPGKNGYEVCATIKADPDIGSTPVMLLTGTFEAFDDARAQEVGADGHITKPFEAQALVDRVNALLSRSTSQGAASAPEAPAPLDNPFEDSNPPAEAFSTAPPPVPGAESGGFGDVPPPVSAAPQPPPIPESPMALESDGDFGNGPASEALTRSYDFFDDDFASSVNPPAATATASEPPPTVPSSPLGRPSIRPRASTSAKRRSVPRRFPPKKKLPRCLQPTMLPPSAPPIGLPRFPRSRRRVSRRPRPSQTPLSHRPRPSQTPLWRRPRPRR